MVLINVKIRTLEGGDSRVEVDDEALLSEFREKVHIATTVEKEQQRLIFRGKALVDDAQTLKFYGLEDEMTVHLVKRRAMAPGENISIDEPPIQQPTYDEQHHHSHVHTHSMIMGNVPVERTQLFQDPDRTLEIMQELLARVRGSFDVFAEASMLASQPNTDDFTINVVLRGQREPTVDSPARERYEKLKKELNQLVWMVSTVQVLFNLHVDQLLIGEQGDGLGDDAACEIIANILQGMYFLDDFLTEELKALHPADDPLVLLAEQLENMQLPEDDEHQQTMDNNIIMRHITATDLTLLLEHMSHMDSHIQEHLMLRYYRVLSLRHSYDGSSYPARLLNGFTTAISRIQHLRSHIYHIISDFGVHVDMNPLNRIFPQYILYERDDPPEANINFVFCHPRNSNPANRTNSGIRSRVGSVSQASSQPQAPPSGQVPSANVVMPSISPMNGALTGGFNFGNQRVAGNINQPFSPLAGGIMIGQTGPQQPLNVSAPMRSQPFANVQMATSEGATTPGAAAINTQPPTTNQGFGPFGQRMPQIPTGGMHPPRGFRIPRPAMPQMGIPQNVSFQVGAGPAPQPGTSQTGFRISFQTHTTQPSSSSGTQEPMDTTGSQPGSPPINNQRTANPMLSNSLGQALSEFMNMASQMGSTGGQVPINIRSFPQQTMQQNRSNPTLLNNVTNTHAPPRRSNSTSRLAAAGSAAPGAQREPNQARVNRAAATDPYQFGGRQAPYRGGDNGLLILLTQSFRRIRNFELDARHNDFWNDPFTVASGRRLRERNADSNTNSMDESSATPANSSATTNAGAARPEVRVNNNGEAVFTDEEIFRDYIFSTFEQVAMSMAEAAPSTRQSSSESAQVFGYSPAMSWPMLLPPGAAGFPSEIVGVFSATAEIPMNVQMPMPGVRKRNSMSTTKPRREFSRRITRTEQNYVFHGQLEFRAIQDHILDSQCVHLEGTICQVCKFEKELRIPLMPEMIFPHNCLALKMCNQTEGNFIEFNAFDALRLVDVGKLPNVKVGPSAAWKEARKDLSLPEFEQPFDWTYTSSYKGTLAGNSPIEQTTEKIDFEKLKQRETIHFYSQMTLYEDELADHGMCDTRIFGEAGKPYVLREWAQREANYAELSSDGLANVLDENLIWPSLTEVSAETLLKNLGRQNVHFVWFLLNKFYVKKLRHIIFFFIPTRILILLLNQKWTVMFAMRRKGTSTFY
uniref:TIP41-like protein n=1 Tax=Ditylenchus dipsaci TaxID=166011 RepID=A0A915CTY3_9BILA